MGVVQSLEVPGFGRLTVRDGVEAYSVDAPGGVFDDAISFRFESSPHLPPEYQIHFLQFAAHELRVHGERGDFSAHGDSTLSLDPGHLVWRVDTLSPVGGAASIRPWYDAGGNHSVDGATLTMADRPGFTVPGGMVATVAGELAHPANHAELARCGTPISADYIQHFDTYVVGLRPAGLEVIAHVRWQSINPLDHLDTGVAHAVSAAPMHAVHPPERAFAVTYDQWAALGADSRPLHHYADQLPHGADSHHGAAAPPSPAHSSGYPAPHSAIEGALVNPHPTSPPHPASAVPGMDFHHGPAAPVAPLPGMDFGADHHDAGKHPGTEIPHHVALPPDGSLIPHHETTYSGSPGTSPNSQPQETMGSTAGPVQPLGMDFGDPTAAGHGPYGYAAAASPHHGGEALGGSAEGGLAGPLDLGPMPGL
ncbi:hypothetical protein OHA40_02855 [Nocardia sp. NBC_00508]|uniref:hypothetical protein n=1 Tax=Nocardia sp. NBC_00508 TaxID=2975992 RepID=UPI002E81DC74|nr:hypothetical protein [Nocardia sp. NBC_00508]WUD67118.1 hypothetical protein OHA40_02855 [Nocardia sp. NBC_00508]